MNPQALSAILMVVGMIVCGLLAYRQGRKDERLAWLEELKVQARLHIRQWREDHAKVEACIDRDEITAKKVDEEAPTLRTPTPRAQRLWKVLGK